MGGRLRNGRGGLERCYSLGTSSGVQLIRENFLHALIRSRDMVNVLSPWGRASFRPVRMALIHRVIAVAGFRMEFILVVGD